jgi:hypothetical protein
MKIWEKVNNITGNDSKSRYLVPYINAGSKFLLSALPEKFLWTIASETEVNGWDSVDTNNYESLGQGSAIAYDKILAVYRYDGATTTSVTLNSVTTDYYRGKKRVAAESPDKNIHIFDESSSLLSATKMFPKFYKLSGKIYIKPDPDYNATDSQQTYTPLGGISENIAAKAGDKGVIVYSAPPIIDENTDSWILTEYENIVLFYAASLDHFRLSSVYRDLCKTQIDAIVTTIINNYKSNIPSIILPSEPSGTLTFSISGSLPSSIVLSRALPTFSFSDSLPSDIAVSAALPTTFSISSSLPSFDGIISPLPSDFSISSSLPSSFSLAEALPSDFSSPTTVTKPTEGVHSLDNTSITDALTKAEKLIDDASGGAYTTTAEGWLADEDSEMVNSTVGVANIELQRAGAAIQKEKTKLEAFSAKLGERMSIYQNDISKYSSEVQKEANRIKSKLDKHNAAVSKEDSRIKSDITKYSAEVQKESGRMSSSLAKYEREVSKSISKYQADVAAYQAEIQKEAQRTGVDVSIYNAQLSKEKTRVDSEIARYQASLSKSIQTFTLDVQVYQAEVQKEGQRISSEISKYEAEIGKASKDMEKQVQQFTLDMQNYGQIVGARNQKFQAELADANKYLQEATTKLQAAQVYTSKSQQSIQTSGMYYQRAVNELSAITGSITAPEPQQSSQRKEQGAST